jgi:NAD(P)-dependent dehydrogenase (short-subunit alcohol dehydrogenase family)
MTTASHPQGLVSLEGRTALVAGGGGGIGAAVGSLFLAAGARVLSVDLAGRGAPDGAEFLECDLTQPDRVRVLFADLASKACEPQIVVHCAGITRDAVLWKLHERDWSQVLSVNLDSAFFLLREAAPAMRRAGGGAVVLVSSINGERGKLGQSNYAASKAGLNALARSAALELGRFGVRVNAVAPGWVETPMTADLDAGLRERAVAETPLGRLGRPEDVAGAALFLCSDMSRHITGQVLRVDGGQLMA